MDRRRESRFSTSQPAKVTVLGEWPESLEGSVTNLSGRGLRLRLQRPLPLNAAVRVDMNGSVLLGEVCYNAPDESGCAVGLMLDQVLHGNPGLIPLLRSLQEARERTFEPAAP